LQVLLCLGRLVSWKGRFTTANLFSRSQELELVLPSQELVKVCYQAERLSVVDVPTPFLKSELIAFALLTFLVVGCFSA